MFNWACMTLMGGACALAGTASAGTLELSEVRLKGSGTEFVELTGPPDTVLDGLTFVVIGDFDPNFPDVDDVGTVESIVPLDGGVIGASGVFLISESAGLDPDLIVDFGPFGLENSGQNTYLIVDGFTGMLDQDLDTDNDGTLDVLPWTTVFDAVGLIGEDTGFPYGASLGFADVGPDGTFTPGHIFRCGLGGAWLVGNFFSSENDTPGAVNPCPSVELSVSKSGPSIAVSGSELVFTVTVANSGGDPAESVEVFDTLPSGMTFVSETSPPEVVLVDDVGRELGWEIATVGPNVSYDIEITVMLAEDASGPLTNTAEVTTTTVGDDPLDNIDEVVTVASPIIKNPATDVTINEVRVDQQGGDNDEYFELRGPASTDLAGLAYIVIGDGTSEQGSGVVESVTGLTGQLLSPTGLFVAAEDTFTLIPPFLVNLLTSLNFENGDNVTHVLVANFSGAVGDDLDTDDDGILDVTPWTHVIDAIGLVESPNPPTGTEYAYGEALGFFDLGPNGPFVPAHAYRCLPDGIWRIGGFVVDPMDPEFVDTPATENPECPGVMLAVSKSGPETTSVGAMLTYSLVVSNQGLQPAADVTIVDTLPDGLTFVSESSPEGVTLDDQTEPDIGWSVASVGPKESFEILLTVMVGEGVGEEIINTVDVTTSSPDDDPGDNSDIAATAVVGAPPDVLINEIRGDQPGTDNDEYFELRGDPDASLDGLTYIVIGDGGGGSGVIDAAVPLAGVFIPASGLLVVAEDTFTLGTADLTADLNFENSDNVTHLIALNFSGMAGDDLDTDDDGVLDVLPWTSVLDAVGLVEEPNPPSSTEYVYGAALGFEDVGPDGTFVPGHVYRCQPDDTWTIGVFDFDADDDGMVDAEATDTPGAVNPDCPAAPCPADTDGNDNVDVDDLVAVILAWGTDGSSNNSDVNGDGTVNVDDLVAVILAWGACP